MDEVDLAPRLLLVDLAVAGEGRAAVVAEIEHIKVVDDAPIAIAVRFERLDDEPPVGVK